MASTLGQLKIKLNYALGTEEVNLFTNDKRVNAINRAIEAILEQYPIVQYKEEHSISFTAGVADLPTDWLWINKLWNTSNNVVYTIVDANVFDDNLSNTATIKWDTTVPAKLKMYIYSPDTVTLMLRKTVIPTSLLSDSDTTRFDTRWDQGIVSLAAYFLLSEAQRSEAAVLKKQLADNLISKVWQRDSQIYQSPSENRLVSAFEKKSLLHSNRYNSIET